MVRDVDKIQTHMRNFLPFETTAAATDSNEVAHFQMNVKMMLLLPLAWSAGKEEENGNKGQEQQTPGEIHSEAHCSSTAALTFILHTSETSCLVSTNCGVDIRAVNRPSQSFTGWL